MRLSLLSKVQSFCKKVEIFSRLFSAPSSIARQSGKEAIKTFFKTDPYKKSPGLREGEARAFTLQIKGNKLKSRSLMGERHSEPANVQTPTYPVCSPTNKKIALHARTYRNHLFFYSLTPVCESMRGLPVARGQWASSQLSPLPASTTRGTANSAAADMRLITSARTLSSSLSGTSNTSSSWTCMIMRVDNRCSASH